MEADDQKHINEIVNNCLHFAGKNGRMLGKQGNPFSKSLRMSYASDSLSIEFNVLASPFSNGSCSVKVTDNGVVVLEADGNYTAYAHGMTAKTYVSGDWEKRIPEWKR